MELIPMRDGLMLAAILFALGLIGAAGAAKCDLHPDVDRGHAQRRRAGLCGRRRAMGPAGRPGRCFCSFWRWPRRKCRWAWRWCCELYHQFKSLDADAISRDERLTMLELLWLIPAFPFAGALVLALLGSRLSRKSVAAVGVGSIATLGPHLHPDRRQLPELASRGRNATRRSSGPGSTSAASARRSPSIWMRSRW